MKQQVFRRAWLPLVLGVVLSGCSLAPKYERPQAPVPAQLPLAGAAAESSDMAADLGWREFFRDPQLQALIELALENNRDLRMAVYRVDEARGLYGVQFSDRLPTIGIGGQGQLTRLPEDMRQPGADSVTRTYQAGLGITSFEIDLFGRVRNLSEAAYQQYLATEAGRRTAHIALVAQVAQAYFSLRAAEQQYALAGSTLKARQQSYDLVKLRYDNGVAGALDLNQASSQLESVRADLVQFERLKTQAANALQLLLGQSVPADLPTAATFGKDQLLAQVPVGLSSEVLLRRPDIDSAEHQLLGANANIGAARAAFFPNISLTGILGFASPALGGLFGSGNRYWTFQPNITMPIFAGGTVGNLQVAEARKNIAIAQYEKSIQTAFREVADALAGEATYAAQLDALRRLEQSAAESLELSRLRYDNGIDSFLQVQTAEITLFTTQQQFIQVGLASLTNRVELYKALGGGWNADTVSETSPDTEQAASTTQGDAS
ncbi:efflux transporter outer membrane subunit [Pusillimonas sp. CC-YST705]|uniref:Efflux transporter outer membrane subunit n=1 Tax=Mesopusillimonas faecipullorum TaxID=2755040 RepID=A0ABS8CC28_9BURK|nr:efflux transporter outer membrane subunit [Mesopusillimonas faecipullorum]MCB5363159.1 efflux transporter outer membrane subunit [Mesopusillimonas faecipullorum]